MKNANQLTKVDYQAAAAPERGRKRIFNPIMSNNAINISYGIKVSSAGCLQMVRVSLLNRNELIVFSLRQSGVPYVDCGSK
jgi:hypothetical protein